jgi:hypothetical protein
MISMSLALLQISSGIDVISASAVTAAFGALAMMAVDDFSEYLKSVRHKC